MTGTSPLLLHIYIISYILPWVLKPKKYYHLEISSLSLKGSTVFLAFQHNYCPLGRALCLPYSSAFLQHVNITVSYDLTGQKLLCGKARNTVEFLMIVFFGLSTQGSLQLITYSVCFCIPTASFPGVTFIYIYYFYFQYCLAADNPIITAFIQGH